VWLIARVSETGSVRSALIASNVDASVQETTCKKRRKKEATLWCAVSNGEMYGHAVVVMMSIEEGGGSCVWVCEDEATCEKFLERKEGTTDGPAPKLYLMLVANQHPCRLSATSALLSLSSSSSFCAHFHTHITSSAITTAITSPSTARRQRLSTREDVWR
jgi:hypothetical protein